MAQVTYRGVKYDTKDSKSCQKQVSELVYRGIKHTESKTVCARWISLTWTKYKAPFDRVLFLIYNWTMKNSKMLHMREQLIAAVKAHAQGEIAKHRANVNVYLEHPAGIGEHSDITEAIQVELDKIARYHDQVEVIDQYFK